uniref:S-adenosylmethionine mitochondrial carrier protein n=1 Tax=Acrobeloides nanus TaxID=290746 RepID=A0A914C6P2_9BILA
MSSVALGAAPGSALFFMTYSATKHYLNIESVSGDAFRASLGEIAACLVRVPTELIKQRSQTTSTRSVFEIAKNVYKVDGFSGFYRGYWSLVAREIPFSFIEFPLWEWLKRKYAQLNGVKQCSSVESAACGSIAGAIAAGLTTPLDVAKTRIMLETGQRSSIVSMLFKIARNESPAKLFSGIYPRMCYLSLGAFVFFFAYEFSLNITYKLF